MELNARKQAILSAIVRTYIETGEPIGSKALCGILDLGLSSATLRNEMSELGELGYLDQPHTSAGRIPTSKGYRLYVDEIMRHETISPEMRKAIDAMFQHITGDPEQIPAAAGEILAELTGLPALSATVVSEGASLARAEIMPMGRRSALLVLVTSDGAARSRLCRTAADLSAETISRFDRIVASELIGTELSSLTPVLLQNLAVRSGASLGLLSLLTSLFEMVREVRQAELNFRGESNLFSFYKQDAQARRLIELIARRDAILSILSELPGPVNVVFGDDTQYDALKPSSLVVANYQTGQKTLGRIGVIGPTRMSYNNLIPGVAYFAKKLSELMSEALKDMEE